MFVSPSLRKGLLCLCAKTSNQFGDDMMAGNGAQLNPGQLATLRMLRNGQLLGGLIRGYRSRTQRQLFDIHAALNTHDVANIARIAHSLKSASFSLGATH